MGGPSGKGYRWADVSRTNPMKVKVRLLPTKKRTKTVELGSGATVEDAIRSLGLYPDAWIAIRGEAPVPLDERLRDGDFLKLISVVSGG